MAERKTKDKELEDGTAIHIKVNDVTHTQDCGFYETVIYTLKIDDNTVLMALCDTGFSAIPTTWFFKYSDGKIEQVGSIANDIRLVTDKDSTTKLVIEKGVIKWKQHIGILGVNPIVETKWNGKELTTVWDGEFNVYTAQESYKVKKDTKVMTDYNDENSKVVIKANQNIKITKVYSELQKFETDAYREHYLYFEAEDGTKGWTTIGEFTEEDIDGITFAG